jgi:hypothetical protein
MQDWVSKLKSLILMSSVWIPKEPNQSRVKKTTKPRHSKRTHFQQRQQLHSCKFQAASCFTTVTTCTTVKCSRICWCPVWTSLLLSIYSHENLCCTNTPHTKTHTQPHSETPCKLFSFDEVLGPLLVKVGQFHHVPQVRLKMMAVS